MLASHTLRLRREGAELQLSVVDENIKSACMFVGVLTWLMFLQYRQYITRYIIIDQLISCRNYEETGASSRQQSAVNLSRLRVNKAMQADSSACFYNTANTSLDTLL